MNISVSASRVGVLLSLRRVEPCVVSPRVSGVSGTLSAAKPGGGLWCSDGSSPPRASGAERNIVYPKAERAEPHVGRKIGHLARTRDVQAGYVVD